MNKDNERITYEEFMTMFKNAPRIAYTLYDKAEDEIDRLNNIINELENELSKLYEYYYDGMPKALCKHLLDVLKELKGTK